MKSSFVCQALGAPTAWAEWAEGEGTDPLMPDALVEESFLHSSGAQTVALTTSNKMVWLTVCQRRNLNASSAARARGGARICHSW